MARQDQRATIVEVARAAGVSTATVSVVLNDRTSTVRISEATRAAVKEAAARLGYIPNQAAQSLRRQRTTMLTLIVGSLTNPYFIDIATSVRARAVARGYEVNVVDADLPDAEVQALDQLRNGSSAGVIIASGRHVMRKQAISALQDLVRRGLPAVMLNDRSPDAAIPVLRIDDAAGAFLATTHLLSLGHHHIAHLSAQHSTFADDDSSVESDRFYGYVRALNNAGIAYDPALLFQDEPTLAGGYAMTQALLARAGPRPTALFCVSDLVAIGALRALYEANMSVPNDMAVIGFDGIELGCYTTPSLTTVDQPRVEMGRSAADMLFAQLDGHQPTPGESVFPITLRVRESCGALARNHRTLVHT